MKQRSSGGKKHIRNSVIQKRRERERERERDEEENEQMGQIKSDWTVEK